MSTIRCHGFAPERNRLPITASLEFLSTDIRSKNKTPSTYVVTYNWPLWVWASYMHGSLGKASIVKVPSGCDEHVNKPVFEFKTNISPSSNITT